MSSSSEEHQATSGSGVITLYNPSKKTNPNQCGIQMTDLCVVIGRYSFNSQHGGRRIDRHPANVGYSISGTQATNKETTQQREANGKNGQEKTTKIYFTVILRAILLKESIGKE